MQRRYTIVIGSVLLFAAFIAVRGWFAFIATRQAGPIIDTAVFIEMGNAPIFSKTFLGGARPPVVPLVFKLCDNNLSAIIYIETVFSIACWLFFGWTLAQWMRDKYARVIAFLMVLLLSLGEPVIVWESCLLSESISLSLMVAMIGAWLLLLKNPTGQRFVLVGSLAVLWAFTRETNAWMVLVVGMLCVPAAVYLKNRRYLALALTLVAAFVVGDVSSTSGKRWMFPFLNVLSERILPDSSRTAWFKRHGMPITPALTAMTNTCASCRDYAYYKEPDLETFRQWLHARGKHTYMLWMLSHPATTLREPLSNIERLVAAGSQFLYASPSSKRLLPAAMSKLLFPICYERYFSLLAAWVLVLGVGIVIGARMWSRSIVWLVPVALVLLAYPHWLIVWHGDNVAEVGRHSLAARMQLNIAWWMMLLLAIDAAIMHRRFPWQSTASGGYRRNRPLDAVNQGMAEEHTP